MSKLSHTRDKMYKTVARQLHGVVPCWICGGHVEAGAATLEHIVPRSEGGNGHAENLAISHEVCNNRRHSSAGKASTLPSPSPLQRELDSGEPDLAKSQESPVLGISSSPPKSVV